MIPLQMSSADPLADLFLNNAPEDEVLEVEEVEEVIDSPQEDPLDVNTGTQEEASDPLGEVLSEEESEENNTQEEASSDPLADIFNAPASDNAFLKNIPVSNATSSKEEEKSAPETSASDIQKEVFQKTTSSSDNSEKKTISATSSESKKTGSSFRASSQVKRDIEKEEAKTTSATNSIPFNTGVKPSPAWLAQQKSASKSDTAAQKNTEQKEGLHGAARQIPQSGASEMVWLLLSGMLAGGVSFARRKKSA